MDSQEKLIGKRVYAIGFIEEMTLKPRRVTLRQGFGHTNTWNDKRFVA